MASWQHNRLHNGRPMRVQLRDRNPSRGIAWRYARGRGKYSHPSLPRHYFDSAGVVSQETSLEKDSNGELQEQILDADSAEEGNITPAAVTYPTLLDSANGINNTEISPVSFHRFEGMVSSSPDGQVNGLARVRTPEPTSVEFPRPRQTSPQSSTTREAPSQYEGQDWNQGTDSSAPLTPAPSSYASSASAATSSVSYPVSNMGYYQPQSWMPPFAQQFPLPIPFIAGYPGYTLPSQPVSQSFTSSSGSESSGQNAGTQVPWASNGGIYPVYIRFRMFPSQISLTRSFFKAFRPIPGLFSASAAAAERSGPLGTHRFYSRRTGSPYPTVSA